MQGAGEIIFRPTGKRLCEAKGFKELDGADRLKRAFYLLE